jgi:hypothetical protein
MKKKIALTQLKVESFATLLEPNKLLTAQGGTFATGNDQCVGPTREMALCTGT